MQTRTRRYSGQRQFFDTLEELGKLMNVKCEVVVDVHIEQPEPRTWEHPGSLGAIEIESVTVTAYCNGDLVLTRSDRNDWFEWLDRVVASKIDEERAIDRLNDEYL